MLFAALFAVVDRNSLEPGLVGFSVSYALQVSKTDQHASSFACPDRGSYFCMFSKAARYQISLSLRL